MLPHDHVQSLINSSERKIKSSLPLRVNPKTQFKKDMLQKYHGGWVMMHMELLRGKQINYIISFHKEVDAMPFNTFTSQNTIYPVCDELLNEKIFNWDRIDGANIQH